MAQWWERPMWPGFKSRRRRHMWVEFVVSSLLRSERLFSGHRYDFLAGAKAVLYSVNMALERSSYGLEMKTREQDRNSKRTKIQRFDRFVERIQTRVAFGWLSERSAEKSSCPKNCLKSNGYFAYLLPSSILGFSLAGKRRVHVLIFSSIGW